MQRWQEVSDSECRNSRPPPVEFASPRHRARFLASVDRTKTIIRGEITIEPDDTVISMIMVKEAWGIDRIQCVRTQVPKLRAKIFCKGWQLKATACSMAGSKRSARTHVEQISLKQASLTAIRWRNQIKDAVSWGSGWNSRMSPKNRTKALGVKPEQVEPLDVQRPRERRG